MNTNEWIDISVPLKNGMVSWPGDPVFESRLISSIEKGDEINITAFSTCAHIGTHIDAPSHYIKNAADITSYPLTTLTGIVRILFIDDERFITKESLEKYSIKKGERIFFKTTNSNSKWLMHPFKKEYVALTTEAAIYLRQQEIILAGIDYLSIAGEKNSHDVHTTLLEAQICIVEGLDLSKVKPGEYEMVCLPLKITGSDGAPARVIIREIL